MNGANQRHSLRAGDRLVDEADRFVARPAGETSRFVARPADEASRFVYEPVTSRAPFLNHAQSDTYMRTKSVFHDSHALLP
jgi:hypothetical protein